MIEVVCCYARKDQSHLQRFKAHLTPLQRKGLITLWTDSDMHRGAEWDKEIKKHLETARIILLLISPEFMASDYCYSKEMMRALERQRKGEVYVVPIILRPVRWQDMFGQLQPLPGNGRPVTSWSNQDEAFYGITNHIIELINNMNGGKISSLAAFEMYSPTGSTKKKGRRVLGLSENSFYREDWSSAPRIGNFYGCKEESVKLKQLRLALLLGSGTLAFILTILLLVPFVFPSFPVLVNLPVYQLQQDSCSDNGNGIILYVDPAYTGHCHFFPVGEYDLATYNLDQNVSSLKDPQGMYHITFRDKSNRPGYFDCTTSQLPADWNDQPHSLQVEKGSRDMRESVMGFLLGRGKDSTKARLPGSCALSELYWAQEPIR